MMNNKDKYRSYFVDLPEANKHEMIKNQALELNRKYKKMVKLEASEFNSKTVQSFSKGGRKGMGRATQLVNAQRSREEYNEQAEMLKYSMELITR